MPESHNIEYKTNWRDEYLKWICGFANANGGKLYIDLYDKGKVAGIDNYNKLLEELPNKFLGKGHSMDACRKAKLLDPTIEESGRRHADYFPERCFF